MLASTLLETFSDSADDAMGFVDVYRLHRSAFVGLVLGATPRGAGARAGARGHPKHPRDDAPENDRCTEVHAVRKSESLLINAEPRTQLQP